MNKAVVLIGAAILIAAGFMHFAPSFKDPVMLGALVIAVALVAGAIWLLRLRDKRQGQGKQ